MLNEPFKFQQQQRKTSLFPAALSRLSTRRRSRRKISRDQDDVTAMSNQVTDTAGGLDYDDDDDDDGGDIIADAKTTVVSSSRVDDGVAQGQSSFDTLGGYVTDRTTDSQDVRSKTNGYNQYGGMDLEVL